MHAWFSEQMAQLYGSSFYSDQNGALVEVTDVTQENVQFINWHDTQYRGVVEKYAKNGRKGSEPELFVLFQSIYTEQRVGYWSTQIQNLKSDPNRAETEDFKQRIAGLERKQKLVAFDLSNLRRKLN